MEERDTFHEGANINRSLLALTNCINILSSNRKKKASKAGGKGSFIPYRDSKLTRILKESLEGDIPVLMIVCLSPNSIYLDETLYSIKYAEKAM